MAAIYNLNLIITSYYPTVFAIVQKTQKKFRYPSVLYDYFLHLVIVGCHDVGQSSLQCRT